MIEKIRQEGQLEEMREIKSRIRSGENGLGSPSDSLNVEGDMNNLDKEDVDYILDIEEDLNGNGILDVSYPNSYALPNIISVASIDSNRQLASNSNYGNIEVDLAAPGELIFSTINLDTIKETEAITLSDGTTVENQWTDENGHTWRRMSDGSTLWWNGTDWQQV